DVIRRLKLQPAPRAWDLLSIALAVIAADTGVRRTESPDGWTREIDLRVAAADSAFWTSQGPLIDQQLRFLTNDVWRCTFGDGGVLPAPPRLPTLPEEDCVALLSGGLDSLVGVLDLVIRRKRRPYVVSQVSQGDKETQADFAAKIGGGLRHLQLNHNANCPGENERSQRARSLTFLAYGVLAATAVKQYHEGQPVTLYVCENGFISINPPLTTGRLGSLSTRTTHPVFLGLFQKLLDAAGLRVRVENPCQFMTKGEMLARCADQDFLRKNARQATSCGRFARNGYKHCGRCVPCLVRRAAFQAWGETDRTVYVYRDLSRDSDDYARFDDVRSAAMAVAEVRAEGLNGWLGTSLSAALLGDVAPYRQTVERGLLELGSFLEAAGVR
ncbi:MAG TPA: Qat anti-phage system QueC-like protein QatC, partial [Methylomirabilota bacterium]|nr:Qat anti-phage system QueC-like protein QatC [Methylomirabilota bacterium]